jgi:hypothetical protein
LYTLASIIFSLFTIEKGFSAMSEKEKKGDGAMDRRDFLRNSAYAAYATPIVLSMLVEKASAAKSFNSGKGELTKTGSPPPNAPVGPDSPRWTKDNNPK